MKNVFLALFACLFIYASHAQLYDGDIAPDFTITDIDGTEHSLYEDYLHQGYSVVIDFSTTWCGPCWSYHETHALADLYENHGPAGMPGVSENTTDDVMVFFMEVDNITNFSDLDGTGFNTEGDWISGTPYPIIDGVEYSIGGDYRVTYIPLIMTICPEGLIQQSETISAQSHYNLINSSCDFAEHDSDASVSKIISEEYYCGDAYIPEVLIQNLSASGPLTSATVSVSQYGSILSSLEWEGSLETYHTETVTLPGVQSIDNQTPLVFTISIPSDMDSDNNSLEKTVSLPVTSEELNIEILMDNFEGISYQLKDPGGGFVALEGGFESNTLYNFNEELEEVGCYTFIINDGQLEDGLCCQYGNGYFKLMDVWGNEIATGGEFYDKKEIRFRNNLANTVFETEDSSLDLSIYPNPTNEDVTISFNTQNSEKTSLEIVNSLGEVIYSETIASTGGEQNLTVDLSEISTGLYYVTVWNEEIKMTKELSIIK